MIEMRFLEVSRNDALTYGVRIPTNFPIYSFATVLNNQPPVASDLAGLLAFGGGQTLFGIGIMNSLVVANLTDNRGEVAA